MTVFLGYMAETVIGAWNVMGEMAPYLLFGFFAAGVLSVLVSPEWVERHLGGGGLLPVFKSVLFGVPLPLCSCGVIAVTASIRRHGASRGATTGFLIATPQTGVDSILATWGLLGPVMGIFRPLMALLTGVFGGLAVSLFVRETADDPGAPSPETCSAECCTDRETYSAPIRIFRYGFITLPRDIAKSLLFGILIAGVLTAMIPQDFLAQYLGGGFLAMLAMVAIGIPLYVCSTASIPIALGFIHLGATPGAALAFLIAGPATNAATIATVWKIIGRRASILYLATVFIAAMATGLAFDALAGVIGDLGLSHAAHIHQEGIAWWQHVLAVVLLVLIIVSMIPRPGRKPHDHETDGKETGMKVVLKVSGMSCSHCSAAVERGLNQTEGVNHAEVDLKSGRAEVRGEKLDPRKLLDTVSELGYKAEFAETPAE
jgi:uncharacterized protein